ncbi:MAG: heparinase II/III family protein, partial [Pseudomonadota bacterium]
MANSQEYRLAQEKNFFLSCVKKNPVFLLQHVKSLAGVVLARCKVKFLTKLRGQHRGNKMTPGWLRSLRLANHSQCADLPQLLQNIPLFEIKNNAIIAADLAWQNEITDPEYYLAQQRWGILTDELLTSTTSSLLPDAVTQQILQTLNDQAATLETYSTCERIANLVNWLAFMPRQQRLAGVPPDTLKFLEKSLQWVLKHLEFYGQRTGNHILNNARSLILAGVVLQNKFAVATGKLIFQKMLPVLIQPNGFLRERSSHYQLIVLGWLLDAFAYLQATEFYPAIELKFLADYIDSMRSAAGELCDQQGNLQVLIGDISPDLSPIKTTQRLSKCHSAFWPVKVVSTGLRDDWCILHSAQSKVILNCPAGRYPKLFSSHAHNDITSFVWLYHGEPILTDCGRARYTKDPVSTLQKSAYGHNLPLVNGFAPLSESLVINGNWWPTPYASAQVDISSDAAHRVAITHNGFKRATPVKQHQRQIVVDDHQLWIEDFFNGHGLIDLELRWQLPPGFVVVEKNKLFTNGSVMLEIDLRGMQNLPVLSEQRGWASTQYGVAVANPVIAMQWQVPLPFTTVLIFKV